MTKLDREPHQMNLSSVGFINPPLILGVIAGVVVVLVF